MKIALLYSGEVGQKVKDYFLTTKEQLLTWTPDEWNKERFDENFGNSQPFPKSYEEFKPDWLITAWWPLIVHETVLNLAKKTLNFHNSLLPHCRGKHPNFWSIVEGSPYGVTLHELTNKLDAGNVYVRREIKKGWEDTGDSIYKLGLVEIIQLFKDYWPAISKSAVAFPQVEDQATFHLSKEIETIRNIDLDQIYSARKLLNIIRAAECGEHRAYFKDGGIKYKVSVKIEKYGH